MATTIHQTILTMLKRAPKRGWTVNEICEKTGYLESSVGPTISRMVAAGVAQRDSRKRDSRAVYVIA